jgi:hypothetical protein
LKIRILAAACLLLGPLPVAGAAELVSARVEIVDSRYHIDFVVLIDGSAERLRAIMTNHEQLADLSPSIESSRLLSGSNGGNARIEMALRPCVLIILCKTITKVSDAYVEPAENRVRYVAVPELSDFREARETITMTQAQSSGTPRVRFSYGAVLQPAFNMPPVVGPWLIRRQIIRDLEDTAKRVERMMRRDR